ncbi:hypothetical protein B296_00005821 [Ensete ventricosum]|uniref:Uncharacterized protein n=1 Tax=Ensete ventricosum TaxID=4639 RepID=A0A426YM05_ENSVE|nr:hypothetical protein B296_00005821 [Ensete ventricosum]
MNNLWPGSLKEHLVGKKPASRGTSWCETGLKEQPPPAVKEPATAGEGRSVVKQPAEATGKKPTKEHFAVIEERYAKQSAASGPSHPWHLSS